jgi:hypothetical protein
VTPVPSCATLLRGGGVASAPAAFGGLTFPAGAVMTPLQSSFGGTGEFAIQETDVCYAGTADEVNGPFSSRTSVFANLLGAAWGPNSTYPYDGQSQSTCRGGDSCFKSGAVDEYYLSFEDLHSPLTGFFTYHLRLATPPTPPTCNASFYPASAPYVYAWGGFATPPLTKESDSALGGGHAGGYTYGLCSAGTPASILSFMQAAVRATGAPVQAVTASSFNTCVAASGGFYRSISFNAGGGNEWGMNVSSPIFTTATCS